MIRTRTSLDVSSLRQNRREEDLQSWTAVVNDPPRQTASKGRPYMPDDSSTLSRHHSQTFPCISKSPNALGLYVPGKVRPLCCRIIGLNVSWSSELNVV